ncbi:MAG: alpha/beta hydrolase [Candidatus Hydrogenedentes bacterium]|nr:alpha/beta hydrolase [Candidatus Hydrogenedentota bacterium]
MGENTSEAWLLPRENARGVVLFSHGLGQTMAERLEMGKAFHDLGFDVFMYEYGGYWNSSGEPSEKRCFEDVNAAWSYLTDTKEYGANEILVFGESMGTGPSVEIAHRKRPGALVLMSPFTSLVDVAQRRMKLLPVGLLLRHRFDNAAKIRDVTCPVLIMHGVDDHEVPFAQGQRLFELANEPKTLVRMRGGHDAFWIAQEEFKDRVETFAALLFPRLAEPYAK